MNELESLRTDYRMLCESIRKALIMAGYSENEIDEIGPVPMMYRMAGERRAYSETMLHVVNCQPVDTETNIEKWERGRYGIQNRERGKP